MDYGKLPIFDKLIKDCWIKKFKYGKEKRIPSDQELTECIEAMRIEHPLAYNEWMLIKFKHPYLSEIKTMSSIARNFIRKDGSGKSGVDRSTIHSHIRAGRLRVQRVKIDNLYMYYIPNSDQHLPGWGLSDRYFSSGKPGPKSAMEKIGLGGKKK